MIYFAVFIYLCCSVGGLTLVKVGAEHNNFALNPGFFNLSLSYATLIGLCLYMISFVMWIVIVQKFNLSYIQPVTTGLSYVLIIAASIFILKESISLFQWIGLGFILIGVVFMNLKVQ
ncbi:MULTISPECIES: DMT family transporter [Eubacterium]|jgi:multidrug transporter EmrE-like cation transporter|uniref:EamA domain-containing protein n=1 Tax=Eubacterium limosum TaxID=1736 RepID=A0AAC9QTE8_EUBLI|nr:hypothetical protein [Eubacterium limosum]ARD65355.1 hypothetical protein B2M23_07290 [Eubacterium limosum]PWW50193.1 multidrug transporter EmrE-like cation transporter [Eubacterium limosum]UQZ24571.1 hypothetical protein M5595_10130 [Eubacterium limosum]